MNQKKKKSNKKRTKDEDRPFNFKTMAIIVPVIAAFAYIIEQNVRMPLPVVIALGMGAVGSLLFISFRKPEWVFYVLCAYIPFSKELVGGFGRGVRALNMTNILIIIVIIGWFANALKTKEKTFVKSPLNFWVKLFCLFGFFSLFRGASFFGGDYASSFIFPLKRWLTPFFLFFIGLNVIKKKEHIRMCVVIMLIAVTFVGLLAIKDYIDKGPTSSIDKARVSGVMDNPNMLGAFFVYYMFLFPAFILLNANKYKYWSLLVPFLICFRGIQVTFSRGAYIACALGGLVLAFFRSKVLFFVCTFFLVLAVMNPVLLPGGIRARMGSTFKGGELYSTDVDEIKDKSVSNRLEIWKGGLAMIKAQPLLGYGYGTFPHVIGLYSRFAYADAHNSYITIAAEMGIPALIVFLLTIFVLFIKTRWLYHNSEDLFVKALSLGLLAGIAGVLAANMFGSRLVEEQVSSYFWIFAGLVMRAFILEMAQRNRSKKKKEIKYEFA